MKILYLHQYFCTPKGSGGVRSYEFARRWVEAGHEVDVITGISNYDLTIEAGIEQNIDGITVNALGVPYSSNMSFPRRLWSFAMYAIKSSWIALNSRKYDVVLATSTPLTVAIPALLAKYVARRKMIFEVRDVWPDAAVDIGKLKNPILITIARLLEKCVYNAADAIVPLSTGMQQRIEDKGVSNQKMIMIPNCSDLERFSKGDRARFRKKYNTKDKVIILYVGAISDANHIEHLADVIDAMEQNESSKIEFWFVGGGNRFDWLKNKVETKELKSVRLLGSQNREDVTDFLAAADIGIVSFVPEPVYYENSPNKFFDYIAAGLPVLFTRSTWLEPWLKEYKNGFVCKPENIQIIIEKIHYLISDKKIRKKMGDSSRKLAENCFSRDLMANKYLKLMEKIST